jgi:hypothetical protein
VTPAGRFTLSSTMRMIHGIHNDASHLWTFTQVPSSARFAKRYVFVIKISNLADRCPAAI